MNRSVLAITGASGAIYARFFLDVLKLQPGAAEALAIVCTDNAREVWRHELGSDFDPGPFNCYDRLDFNAPFASGSSEFRSMVVMPCSMGILGRIAAGTSNDLITRCADVMLKEKRQLLLVPRETPLNLIHLRNMTALAEAGAHIIPAMPSYYSRPETVDELVGTVCYRVLDQLGIGHEGYRWGNS